MKNRFFLGEKAFTRDNHRYPYVVLVFQQIDCWLEFVRSLFWYWNQLVQSEISWSEGNQL